MKINDISILCESFLSSKEKQNEVSKKIKDLKLQIFSKLNKDITYTAKYKIQKENDLCFQVKLLVNPNIFN